MQCFLRPDLGLIVPIRISSKFSQNRLKNIPILNFEENVCVIYDGIIKNIFEYSDNV